MNLVSSLQCGLFGSIFVLASMTTNSSINAFTAVPKTIHNLSPQTLKTANVATLPTKQLEGSSTKLAMSYNFDKDNNNNNNNNFDLSKPTFDLFSLRTIRNDALLQYSSLNQSEPLRINLFLILTVTAFSFPTISESVIGEVANIQSTIISIVSGIASFSLFIKECTSRVNQLTRIEKEMNAEYLKLSLSTKNKLNPQLFGGNGSANTETTLKNMRGNKRIIAIAGSKDELKDALLSFRIFRRRLSQSNSIVIPIITDSNGDEKTSEWYKSLGVTETEIRSCQWLAQPQDISSWKQYFDDLVSSDDDDSNSNNNKLVWFGLNYNGRSFASGSGKKNSPMLLQILGQNFRPIDLLDESDEAEIINAGNKEVDASVVEDIQSCQEAFYKALTGGDLNEMNSIYSETKTDDVSEVINAGGRIDSWTSCLAEDAKPSNMQTSGSDVLIVSPTSAYSTCIEFPVVSGGGYDNASSFGATLLAVQKWQRGNGDGEWKLEYHSTIPWSPDSRAGGMLRCDCRGCVALTRGPERRTFGGLIG